MRSLIAVVLLLLVACGSSVEATDEGPPVPEIKPDCRINNDPC